MSSSSSSSESPESGSSSEDTRRKNTTVKKKTTRKTRGKEKSRKRSSKALHAGDGGSDSESGSNTKSSSKLGPLDKDFGDAARAVARCVDLFCNPRKVIEYITLIKQEDAASMGGLEESESERKMRKKLLRAIPPKQKELNQRVYDMFIKFAPALKDLIDNPKKRDELRNVLNGMKRVITCARSDDSARLKERIGRYVSTHGDGVVLPPILTTSKSQSHLGFAHPIIARFLCPIDHIEAFAMDPKSTQKKLLDGQISVSSDIFPAFLWDGHPPGSRFNEENMHEGMFRGFYLERVFLHVLNGASSAFGEERSGSRPCNADLHQMTKVEAANIAYACVQARYHISSKSRWSEMDGAFNYRHFYYTVLDAIEGCADEEWKEALLRHYNKLLFKNENGREDPESKGSSGENGTSSFLEKLRAQAQSRALGANDNAAGDDAGDDNDGRGDSVLLDGLYMDEEDQPRNDDWADFDDANRGASKLPPVIRVPPRFNTSRETPVPDGTSSPQSSRARRARDRPTSDQGEDSDTVESKRRKALPAAAQETVPNKEPPKKVVKRRRARH